MDDPTMLDMLNVQGVEETWNRLHMEHVAAARKAWVLSIKTKQPDIQIRFNTLIKQLAYAQPFSSEERTELQVNYLDNAWVPTTFAQVKDMYPAMVRVYMTLGYHRLAFVLLTIIRFALNQEDSQ